MHTQKLHAGTEFPSVSVTADDGTQRDISKPEGGRDWMMVIAYRGAHCPRCTDYLNQLEGLLPQFHEAGIDVVAVSGDSAEQVARHREQIDVTFPIYYGMSVEQMEQLGLYISDPRSAEETDHRFGEPGMFVIDESGNLVIVDISNNPFARPELAVIIKGLRWMRSVGYPIRGTYAG